MICRKNKDDGLTNFFSVVTIEGRIKTDRKEDRYGEPNRDI